MELEQSEGERRRKKRRVRRKARDAHKADVESSCCGEHSTNAETKDRDVALECCAHGEDEEGERGERVSCYPVVKLGSLSLVQRAQLFFFASAIVTLDYSLMLIAMTFNVGLCIAVVFGFGLAHAMWGHCLDAADPTDCCGA